LNFDDLVMDYHTSAEDIQSHYSVELEVEDGVIYSRSKPDMDVSTPWSERTVIFPPRVPPFPETISPDKVPSTEPFREWTHFEDVQHDLLRFYNGEITPQTVHIPEDVRDRK
jgi:hypothetical protein